MHTLFCTLQGATMGADYFKEKPTRQKGETQEPEYRAPPSEAGMPSRPQSARTPAAVRPAEVPLECNNVTCSVPFSAFRC